MAKFGLLRMATDSPSALYEGDYMKMEKEFVQILKYPPAVSDPFASHELVAAIRLEKGYDVRKISE